MEQFIGLDVSLKETHICVVDGQGDGIYVTAGNRAGSVHGAHPPHPSPLPRGAREPVGARGHALWIPAYAGMTREAVEMPPYPRRVKGKKREA